VQKVRFEARPEKEETAYHTLVLVPGATPKRLPIDGVDLQGVYTLRGVADAAGIDRACQEGKRPVVLGSSFDGMEGRARCMQT
jgi:NAD(P)H-nitrite reductase large subunit